MQTTLKAIAIFFLCVIIFLMLLRELIIKYVHIWHKDLTEHYKFLLTRFFKQLD